MASTRSLILARRAKQTALRAHDPVAREQGRQAVDRAKHALGERGPIWWTNGAPKFNRNLARNTPCAWFSGTQPSAP